jgi:hypothetical protein
VRISVDAAGADPALLVTVPDRPQTTPSAKILFPEHLTVRARGHVDAQHLYLYRPGRHPNPPHWIKRGNSLEYQTDFNRIHLLARASLAEDGIVFHYEFVNHSPVDYDMITAITDPRFHAVFYDPRLERTYIHRSGGFSLLASETPARLTLPLTNWFPLRYLASYTAPIPTARVQHRADGITYYYNSQPIDQPMLATLSPDGAWVEATFSRNSGNVWTNPELTCQHADPERPLPHAARTAYEVKILIFRGSLDDALRKALAQRESLQ